MSLNPVVHWFHFGGTDCVRTALALAAPPLANAEQCFIQLKYIERYAADLHCRSFVVESPYIDRDYIEDHSAFYSKNLYPYPNYCRRIHFFSAPVDDVKRELIATLTAGRSDGIDSFISKCEELSKKIYLGFSVIKPLAATPVGRTVMKCFPAEHPNGEIRRLFSCTKRYVVHFNGCRLSVDGLAFQQQDVGVSACATTALWSALQKTAEDEPIAAMTPVQITQFATKYSLPSGRPMPSEGLDLGQMCSAVQACGVSPNVFNVSRDHTRARILLHSAIQSGFAPILAVIHPQMGGHAVAAVGLKELKTPPIHQSLYHFHQESVVGLYVHDDRLGPNLRCDFVVPNQSDAPLGLEIKLRDTSGTEKWDLAYIMVPMHPKIRLSFANLQEVAGKLLPYLRGIYSHFQISTYGIPESPIEFECTILRAHRYLERLLIESVGILPQHLEHLSHSISVARYLGVVRVTGPFFDAFDLVLDTTATIRNANVLGIITLDPHSSAGNVIPKLIASFLKCPCLLSEGRGLDLHGEQERPTD